MTYDSLFFALGDPTRRAILDAIRTRPRTVGELTEIVPVSQPAVSQHLAVLRQAGLVQVRQEGTRRIHSIAPSGVQELRAYVESFWEGVLDAYQSGVGPAKQRATPTKPREQRKGK
jgi:DNA-binding transcriptional ArsR family regulator